MSLATNVVRRGAVYYVRVRVPKRLVQFVGKSEVWKSLETKDAIDARRKAPSVLDQLHQQFKALERTHCPDESDIQRIVQEWFAEENRADEEYRAERGRLSIDLHRDIADMNQRAADTLRQRLGRGDTSPAENVADALIRANRLEIDQKSDLYKGLTHNLARALAELAEIRVQRDQGRFDAVPRDTYLTGPVAATPAPGERLPDLFDLFITQKRNLTDGVKKDYATTFRYFLDYIGRERSIQSIERTDVRNWRDQLMRFPQYANTKKEFKGLSFKEVLALNDKLNQPTLDEKTINKYISTVGSFMKWAIKRGVIDNDPTHSLMLEVDDEDNKDPFTLAQLATIFSSPIWTGCAASKRAQRHLPGTVQAEDQYRWAPLIALFSGARMEEILRLTTDDLLMVDSIACMNITTTGGRSLKTRNAKRLVPVHSQLEQLGFIRMVEKRRRAGGGPVFYGMKENAQGRLSSEFSKDFSQYLDGIKVKTERLSFHSFRHNFITWAGHAGLSKASIQIIVGHTAKSVTDSYTHDGVIDLGARGRQAIVERVQYEGLYLSHLRG